MTEDDWLLVCLAEECAESIHAVCKALRFGKDDSWAEREMTNAQAISLELSDLQTVSAMCQKRNLFEKPGFSTNKAIRVEKYMKHAKDRGRIVWH